jgi:hypothetical protein
MFYEEEIPIIKDKLDAAVNILNEALGKINSLQKDIPPDIIYIALLIVSRPILKEEVSNSFIKKDNKDIVAASLIKLIKLHYYSVIDIAEESDYKLDLEQYMKEFNQYF